MLAWFETVVGPEYAPAAMWTVIALVALIVLLIVLRLLRGLSSGTFVMGGRNRKARLAVMDATAVDANRRLVLVRRDDVEHLILIGGPTDVVVEQNIRPYEPARQSAEPDAFAPVIPQATPARREVRSVQEIPAPASPRAAERPVVAPQRPVAPTVQPQTAQRPPAPQAVYAEPAAIALPVSVTPPEAYTPPVAPAVERPIAPPVAPPVQRDFPAAPVGRAEPTLDMAPRAAPAVSSERDDDRALEEEMNRLLSDFAPEPKR